MKYRRYEAIVKKIVDGDTIYVWLDYGFGKWDHEFQIRLKDVNTPEITGSQPRHGHLGLYPSHGHVLGER